MKVLVNGETKELTAYVNGCYGTEWTRDLLGNYDALHYDRENDEYTMTEDEFEWWENVINTLNEVSELQNELDTDDREEYDLEDWPNDLDDEVEAKLNWLKNR